MVIVVNMMTNSMQCMQCKQLFPSSLSFELYLSFHRCVMEFPIRNKWIYLTFVLSLTMSDLFGLRAKWLNFWISSVLDRIMHNISTICYYCIIPMHSNYYCHYRMYSVTYYYSQLNENYYYSHTDSKYVNTDLTFYTKRLIVRIYFNTSCHYISIRQNNVHLFHQ